MSAAPVLIVIAGPAGSGKSTLCDRLVEEDKTFARVVTTTTRAARAGEVHGVHYHFFTPDEFRLHVSRGDFLEWAQVHQLDGDTHVRLYGTMKSSVIEPLSRRQNLVLSIDVQGVESLRRLAKVDAQLRHALTTVFIVVDHERLLQRMRERAKDNEEEIARRMATAEAELREAAKFDHIIQSGSRDEDFAALQRIVEQAKARAGAETSRSGL